MTAQAVELRTAVGKLLCTSIFHASGKKLLAKGHQISEEDVELLDSAGHDQVWVAVLEESEVPEDEAASRVAGEAACGSLEIRVAAGGRANLFATENSCLLVDEALLRAPKPARTRHCGDGAQLLVSPGRAACVVGQDHAFRCASQGLRGGPELGDGTGAVAAGTPDRQPDRGSPLQRSHSSRPRTAAVRRDHENPS